MPSPPLHLARYKRLHERAAGVDSSLTSQGQPPINLRPRLRAVWSAYVSGDPSSLEKSATAHQITTSQNNAFTYAPWAAHPWFHCWIYDKWLITKIPCRSTPVNYTLFFWQSVVENSPSSNRNLQDHFLSSQFCKLCLKLEAREKKTWLWFHQAISTEEELSRKHLGTTVRPRDPATEVSESPSLAFTGKIILPTEGTRLVSKATCHLYRGLTWGLVIP